jgi:hypothetical protein
MPDSVCGPLIIGSATTQTLIAEQRKKSAPPRDGAQRFGGVITFGHGIYLLLLRARCISISSATARSGLSDFSERV